MKKLMMYMIIAVCLASCNNKMTPIEKLSDLSEGIQQESAKYSDEDWKSAEETMDLIEHDLEQYKSEYTDQELREIGRLKGICLAYFTKHSLHSIVNSVDDALKETTGVIEGFSKELERTK